MKAFTDEKIVQTSQDEKAQSISSSSDSNTSLEQLATSQRKRLEGNPLIFNFGSFPWVDMEVLDSEERPAYYAEVSEFTPNKPDIILHCGSKSGPVCAHSFFGWFTRSFKCGIGSDESSMQWVEFKKGGFGKRRFDFEWRGKTYVLQAATSKDANIRGLARLMLTHFKITEAESDELMALYISEKVGRKKGTLSLKTGLSEDLEMLFVLGIASWRDIIRRRQPKGGAGGGGGGE